ncbi:MAG: hypothetical protein ACRDT6_09570 [Micromonosporaceae bacterium]
MSNDSPHPREDGWSRRLSDAELQQMYRARASTTSGSGGGSSSSQGCLITLARLASLLTVIASVALSVVPA